MEKQEEYNALREEILISIQVIKNYRNVLYATVVATMAFAFDKGKAILFLVPFCAIFSIYFLARHQSDAMLRMGAYINVFLEPGTDCQWETRLYEYDKLYQDQYSTKSTSTGAYISISACCLILSVLHLDYENINIEFCGTIIVQVVILIMCIYLFLIKKLNNLIIKEKYISEWKEIQRNEKQKMHREEKKFKRLILQIYNEAERGKLIGIIYAGTITYKISDLKDIDEVMEGSNFDRLYLKSKLTNTEIDIYKWELEDYNIKRYENKIFIRLKNKMEVELKY